MYGFHKVEDPTGTNNKHFEFKNINFVPGRRELLKKIERRKAVKRTTRNDEDHANKQPNNNPLARKGSVSSIPSHSVTTENKPEPLHQHLPDIFYFYYLTYFT